MTHKEDDECQDTQHHKKEINDIVRGLPKIAAVSDKPYAHLSHQYHVHE